MTTTETNILFVADRWRDPEQFKPIPLPGRFVMAWPDSYIDTAIHIETDAGHFWCRNVYADKVNWEKVG